MEPFNVLEGLSFDYEGDSIVAYIPLNEQEFRLAIVGSREYEDLYKVDDLIERLPGRVVVISGGARGVDSRAVEAAKRLGKPWQEWTPQYDVYGRHRAPLKRNEQIARLCHAMIAFHDGESRGTLHAVRCAQELRKPVAIVR